MLSIHASYRLNCLAILSSPCFRFLNVLQLAFNGQTDTNAASFNGDGSHIRYNNHVSNYFRHSFRLRRLFDDSSKYTCADQI